MSKQYHKNLVEAVGSSFYYYSHHKDLNLTKVGYGDFEKLTNGWLDEYRGNWEIYDCSAPIVYNIFKPCVDQLVYRIMDATEKEIERRFAEKWHDYMEQLETKKD